MKRLLLIPLFAILALTSCERLDIAPGVPECMVEKTKKFNKRLACDDGLLLKSLYFRVKQYMFSVKGIVLLIVVPK